MSILINDNYSVNVGKPIDSKYLNGQTPWTSVAAVNAGIPESYRYTGLTILLQSGTSSIEFWYKEDIDDTGLIEKKFNSEQVVGDFVTGATNIGYFSGFTGVQTLPMNHLTDNDYDGDYLSLYNNYYRGTDGRIHIGTPTDGIPKRGYLKSALPIKSWIWNEYTAGNGNLLGWLLIDDDISQIIGEIVTVTGPAVYYPPSTPHIETGYTAGSGYTNSSNVSIDAVIGSLTTGDTLTIGGRPFESKENSELHFRTIKSETSNICIRDDEAFIYVSGGTTISTANNGLTITGTNIGLGGTLTGDTTISGDGNVFTFNEMADFDISASSLCLSGTNIRIGNSGSTVLAEVCGTAAFSGLTYGGDYSANYISTSLITKGYVDNALSGTTNRIPVYCAGDIGLSASTLSYSQHVLSDTGSLTIYPSDCLYLAESGGGATNRILLGTPTLNATSTCFTAVGACTDIGIRMSTKGDALMRLDACCLFIGAPSVGNSGGHMICGNDICLAAQTCIRGGDGYSSGVDALPTAIKGGFGYSTGGHGGSISICGGVTGGASSCSGGSVHLQGGTGDGSNGRIVLSGLPARTDETSLVYLDASGKLSCGDAAQQPVTICTAGNYTATNSDYFIGTCSGNTVFLPAAPTCGEIKVIADICGSAAAGDITVNGNGKYIFEWSNAVIDTAWGSVTFLYTDDNNNWSVIGFTAAPSYS